MAYVSWVNRHRGLRRRDRIFRDRENPLDYESDDCIVRKYRLSRPLIISLCQMFLLNLQRPTLRSSAFPVSLQIMVALRYYATGSFQSVIGDVHHISRQSVSYILQDVTECLNNVVKQYIYMPTNEDHLNKIKRDFHDIARFPNTVGAIDCTQSPSIDEHLYVNRKNFHSINIQGVCDAELKFLNIIAKWPGSTHDSFIWNNCALKEMFEDGTISDGWLLGDSAYPLRPWLLTPVLNPDTPSEARYNDSHIRTRNTIERAFGVLKSRFRCIDSSGGTLLYTPKKACKIAVATAVLHNMCIESNVPLPDGCNPLDNGRIRVQYAGQQLNDGARVRERLINGRFL